METCFVSCSLQGLEIRGTVLRLQRFQLVFEVYQPGVLLRISEAIEDFRVFLDGESAYFGRAVVTNVVHLGVAMTCEVRLEEPGLQSGSASGENGDGDCLQRYERWFRSWEQHEQIRPEFKMAVMAFHSYLSDFKSLCEQFEISVLAHPSRGRAEAEMELAEQLAPPVLSTVNALRERFLESSQGIDPEHYGAHEALVRRHLHPLFLCAPFGYRTYQKPLGYAGDYEMMNMIHRNTYEGGSLYAKLVHYWLVNQPPSESVRRRVAHLKRRVLEETVRVGRGRPVRVLNLGCGPAREVQEFIAEHPLADNVEFTLLDFDVETLDHVKSAINRAKGAHGRQTAFAVRRISVTQLIKESSQPGRRPLGADFDLVYCGGLFDYLSPRICRQLVGMLYEYTAPGGLVVVANMWDRFRPFSEMLEFLLDWHLVYRSAKDLEGFIPSPGLRECAPVSEDGINLFLELRKPEKD